MTPSEIFQVIRDNVYEVEPELESKAITLDDSLKLLGIPSVSRVEILMLTMESLEIVVPNSKLASAKNLGDLVNLFDQQLNQNQ